VPEVIPEDKNVRAPHFSAETRARAYGFVGSMRAVCRFSVQESTKIESHGLLMVYWRGSPALGREEVCFISSFKTMDSAISFMDLRLSWLSRLIAM